MPVTVNNSKPSPKVTVESNTSSVPGAEAAPPNVNVQLVNGCSTYVTPLREVFYAKNQVGSSRVYSVPVADLPRLLGYADERRSKFFRQLTDEQAAKLARKTRPVEDYEDEPPTVEDGELVDTGAMRLVDTEGNQVGVSV